MLFLLFLHSKLIIEGKVFGQGWLLNRPLAEAFFPELTFFIASA
jgi:hypothetical protein